MTNDQKSALAQQCFFEAMLQGWASGCKATLSSHMPGFKEIWYENEKHGVRVRDFFGHIDELATGTITIWHERNCIWFMSYNGYYRPEDIPLLKDILLRTYREGNFFGGRGPRSCPAGSWIYTNEVMGDFNRFTTVEKISDSLSGRGFGNRGYHNCWGGLV